jgi:hypothetical protein
MIARVHRNRFTHEFQFARELIELLAHLGETRLNAGAILVDVLSIQEAIERGPDEPGLGGATLPGRISQS